MANVDTNEEFWGVTLTGERKVHTWNPAEAEEDVEHKIQVTQACLGQKAKEGERNVIEVTTEDEDGKKISCAIVSLRVGFAECMHLELGFTNPVKFMLKEGSGPISLCGIHLSALPLDLDNDEMESSEDDDDEEVPQLVKVANSKAKIEELPDDKVDEEKVEAAQAENKESIPVVAAVVQKEEVTSKAATSTKKRVLQKEEEKEEVSPKKKKEDPKKEESTEEEKKVESKKDIGQKLGEEEEDKDGDHDEEEDDDDDDDDEEDEEDDVDDIDMEALDEEDMEGLDSEDMDSDDDDDEEDDEEDDDEEDESEEETPKLKKKPPPKVNGIPPKKSNTPASTPAQKSKPLGNKENVNASKNTTPKAKNNKDTPKAPTPKRTPEELKTFLLKSPNLPKKYEKFSNFLKNNMKVTDPKSQKELWEYVQKNKK